MKLQYFFILLTIVFTTPIFGRAPAVEDFVGVEPESYREIKKGNEFAYDFRGDPAPIKQREGNPSNLFSLFALFAFISLPLIMWGAITYNQNDQNIQQGETHNVSYVDFQKSNKKAGPDDEVDKAS